MTRKLIDSVLVTSNLPFEEWMETFGSERLAGALLDWLTRNAQFPEMNGNSFRLANSLSREEKVRERDKDQNARAVKSNSEEKNV